MKQKQYSRNKSWMLPGLAAIAVLACSYSVGEQQVARAATTSEPAVRGVTQGSLLSLDSNGRPSAECPLRHTDVHVSISGFLARVTVTQQFENGFDDAIEAVYVFPLSQRAAVDDMTMKIGERVVKGKIKRREEARRIYEKARAAGQLTSLLDQERPNIFTQSVANIPPGAKVEIEISYVETLRYEEGTYSFSFPMVVGPRYIPGSPTGHSGGGWAADTNQAPDASRITPPVARPPTRAGHDLSLSVSLDAGVPVRGIRSTSQEIDITRSGTNSAEIKLRRKAVLPNKDFVLNYDVAGATIEDTVLTHADERGGFFTLILQPPKRVTAEDVTPKELVFVLDTSGSMSGFPIEKAKEVIQLALNGLYPRDTFNLITFAGDTHVLFPEPVSATTANLARAREFLKTRRGGGSTEMMKAIRVALTPSDEQGHVRIVCFLTDGYVGNDMAILGEVQKHANARVFSFGVGNSVNRFLLDKMAALSRGEAEYVALNDDGTAAARRFHERVRNPLLRDVSIDWGGLPVADVYPRRIPDLFAAKPVVVTGRYTGPASGVIRLKGRMSGREFTRGISLELPSRQDDHDVIATLWARQRISDLTAQDWNGMQQGSPRPEIKEAITQLGLDYRLLTRFTSFVAVEESVVREGGVIKRIEVPVEIPDGVSYEGVFGQDAGFKQMRMARKASVQSLYLGQSIATELSAPAVPVRRPDAARSRDKFRQRKVDVSGKLHPDLEKLAAGKTVEGLTLLNGNEIEIDVWLVDRKPELLAQLQSLGFRTTRKSKVGKIVIGRIPFTKLEEVARLPGVQYVAPHRGR